MKIDRFKGVEKCKSHDRTINLDPAENLIL